MYDFAPLKRGFSEPWLLPLHRRLRDLRRGDAHVAYYYHQADNSTFRYRCYGMVQALAAHAPFVGASYFHAADGPALDEVVAIADTLVVCRATFTAELADLIAKAKRRGVRVLFDSDDIVFEPSLIPLLVESASTGSRNSRDTQEQIWNYWFSYVCRLRATLDRCDGFIGTTDALLEEAASATGLPTFKVPNFMTTEQLEYSRELVALRAASGHARDGRLHLGYFSGSPSHARDFAIALPAILEVLDRNPEAVLRVVGFLDVSVLDIDRYRSQVEVLPFTDYLDLQRIIAITEVNLAPLQQNRFTDCKSELKFFDAAAVGIPTLASPTRSMTAVIEDGRTGYIVGDGDWCSAIESAATHYETSGKVVGERARATSLARFEPAAHVEAILGATLPS